MLRLTGMKKATLFLAPALTLAFAGLGCGTPAAPFNQMDKAQVTILQLQNYEPPPTATAAPAATNPFGLPIALPPELTQIFGGAAGGTGGGMGLPTQQLCGLGIPFPGLCTATPAATAPAAANVQRFQGFRILGTAQMSAEDARADLASALGKEGNFDNSNKPCMYPEYGVAFSGNELLLSFLCRNVEAKTFPWPHPNRGLSEDTQKKIASAFKGLSFMPIQ